MKNVTKIGISDLEMETENKNLSPGVHVDTNTKEVVDRTRAVVKCAQMTCKSRAKRVKLLILLLNMQIRDVLFAVVLVVAYSSAMLCGCKRKNQSFLMP